MFYSIIALFLLYYLYLYLTGKLWTFNRRKLEDIVFFTRHLPLDRRLKQIVYELNRAYPGRVNGNVEFFWTNAGGGMWYVGLIHISMFEYMIFTGNASGTVGHTGRNPVTYTDYVLDGSIKFGYEETLYIQRSSVSNDSFYTPFMGARSYATDGVCCLEYCRGPIPFLFLFGMMDTFFSTMDYWSLIKCFWNVLKFVVAHPLLFFRLAV